MDATIRRYLPEAQEGEAEAPPKAPRRRREKPFAAEYALLRELGLYDEHGRRAASQN